MQNLLKKISSSGVWYILAFAYPNILMSLSQTLMTSFDYVFTRHLGDTAAAAIGPASLLAFVPISFFLGIVATVGIKAASARGQGGAIMALEARGPLIKISLGGLFFVGFAIPVGFILAGLAPLAVNLFDHPATVAAAEVKYLQMMLLTLPGAVLAFLGQNLFSAAGDNRTPAIVVCIGHVINVLLNYLFTISTSDPAVGVEGVAAATVIATLFQAFGMTFLYIKRYRHEWNHLAIRQLPWRGSLTVAKNLTRIGLPVGFQWIQSSLVWLVFTSLIVASLGTIELAAHNVVQQVVKLAVLPIFGLTSAGAILIAQATNGNLSQFSNEHLERDLSKLSVCYGIAIAAICIFFMPTMAALYTTSGQVVDAATSVAILAALYGIFASVESCSIAISRAYEKNLRTAFVSGMSNWMVMIGGGLVTVWLAPDLGLFGPWICVAATFATTATVFHQISRQPKRRRLRPKTPRPVAA